MEPSSNAYTRVLTRWQQLYSEYARRCSLNYISLHVLYEISQNGPLAQKNLAAACGLSKQNLHQILLDFEKRGWIAFQKNTTDRRIREVLLSEQGEIQARPLVQPIAECETRAFEQFSEQEQQLLQQLSSRYVDICEQILKSAD